MSVFLVPDSSSFDDPEMFAEVNHCHGKGHGHPCGTFKSAGTAVGAAVYAAGRAAKAFIKDDSGSAGFGSARKQARKTRMAIKRVRQAVDAAGVAVVELTHLMEKHHSAEDEKVSHALHLGEAAIETVLHHFPDLVHTAVSSLIGEAAKPEHPALPELKRLQAMYAKVTLPKGSTHEKRLAKLKQRIAKLVAAAS